MTSDGTPFTTLPVETTNAFNILNQEVVLQNAYFALTHGVIIKWSYLSRTVPNIRNVGTALGFVKYECRNLGQACSCL